MEWKCKECNMKFHTSTLYDTHKEKFCVLRGNSKVGEPYQLSDQGIADETVRFPNGDREKGKHISSSTKVKTSLPDIQVARHSGLSPQVKYGYNSKSYLDVNKRKSPNLLTSPSGHNMKDLRLSAIEVEKVEELKRLKVQQSRQRAERNLEEKLLVTGMKENPIIHTVHSRRANNGLNKDGPMLAYEDRLHQLTVVHNQQLHELQERNKRLEQEKTVIQDRMKQLNLKSRDKPLTQESLDKQIRELENLKRYAEPKDVHDGTSAEVLHNQKLETQLIPYDPVAVRQYTQPFPSTLPGGDIVNELNMLKYMYVERGGCNRAVLQQIRELEYEAQRLQTVNRPVVQDSVIQQQILAQRLHNQRLEQELQLLKEERDRSKKDRSPSPDLSPDYMRLREEHMAKMTQLKHESELLKQQSEIEKMKRELRELRNEDFSTGADKAYETPFMLTKIGMEKIFLPSPYDPNAGFTIFWDFLLGMHPSFTKCRLAVGIYDGTTLVTDVKVLSLTRVTMSSRAQYPTLPSGGLVLLGLKHPFPRCVPVLTLSLLVELQTNSTDDIQDPDKLYSRGWTKMDLFDRSSRVVSGRWKMPLRVPPIKVYLNMDELNRIPQIGQTELYLRIVNRRDESAEELLSPQPLQHHMYSFPQMENRRGSANNPGRTSFIPQSPAVTIHPTDVPSPSVLPPPDTPRSQVQRSVPGTPTHDLVAVVGFQVDQIIDAIEGEAIIKITGYNGLDGQVLKCEDGVPVMWTTAPAEQDFLHGIHVFGLQERQYKSMCWDLNSVVVLMVYLQPAGSGTPVTEERSERVSNLVDESRPTAWTVLPLAVPHDHTPTARHAGSRSAHLSRSAASLRVVARLHMGTHHLPLFFPPLPDLQHVAVKPGEFPEDWNRYGHSTVIFSVFSGSFQSPEQSLPPGDFRAEDHLPQNVWVNHTRPALVGDPFDIGQGFDLYIDGARFLPDSVTFSKVAGRVMDSGYGKIGSEIDVQAALDTDVYNPEYNTRLEYREPAVPATSTLMLKVYTVDRISKQLCCLGYAFLALYLKLGTNKQPSDDNSDTKVALNEGAHQLRIFNGNPDLSVPLGHDTARTLKPVPCASLLVRLYKAACHPNGRPKEISQFQEGEWENEGLVVLKPRYEDGRYFSLSCEPTPGECQMFHSMIRRTPITVRESVNLIASGQEQKLKNDKLIGSWIKTQLTRSIDTQPVDFAMQYVSLYHPLHGFKVALDAAQNVPWSGNTLGTLCLTPPGSFYKGYLTDPLKLVTTLSFTSEVSSPVWTDGFKLFPRRSYQKSLVVIFHVHEVVVDGSHDNSQPGLHSQAWTAMQVFNEGYVLNGCYQLPLYHGHPTQMVINALQHDACQDVLAGFRRRKVVKILEGSSVFVRLSDTRRAEEFSWPKTNVKLDYLPKDKLDKYTNVNPSKSLSSLTPKNVSEDEFSQVLTTRFKLLTKKNFEENRSGTAH